MKDGKEDAVLASIAAAIRDGQHIVIAARSQEEADALMTKFKARYPELVAVMSAISKQHEDL